MPRFVYMGTQSLPMPGGARVKIKADEPFRAYGYKGEDLVEIYAPTTENERVAVFRTARDADILLVETRAEAHIVLEVASWLDGQEDIDPEPLEIPLGAMKPPSIFDQMKRYIRSQVSAQVHAKGFESFEEANDFEVGEDDEPFSPYEVREMAAEAIDVPDPSMDPEKPAPAQEEPEA